MLLTRASALTLSFATIGFAACSHAEELTTHQLAVTMVVMERLCNQEYPDLKGKAENAMAADPNFPEGVEEEVRKLKEDPASKPELEMSMRTMSDPQLWDTAKTTCKEFASK